MAEEVYTLNVYQDAQLLRTGPNSGPVHVDLAPKEYPVGTFQGELVDGQGNKTEKFDFPAVTVYAPVVAVTGVSIDPETASVEIGKTVALKEKVMPDNATEKGVNWSIADTAIATVSGGVVTGKAVGKTTLTATAKADSKIVGTAEITVTEAVTG
ncbi:hypothetical protein FC83_GL000917 [Agrilactobacillus composti DSM 18527 = JCM 14202]|uniref:BIG2 domain-containing protein n=1 Tax=Agrilactobacillus composti DSM 18527 = JCM 14202 TaxID=1423734 RepID=X0PUQ0_9LACO|nr:Ig-like domain-containing protein [Agrilactobacillus composti]KRM35614.1 hypothetical protein FC83_GL000917 [Agrilactobacillus composti DSM 18527 = JCM 14202]GAF41131.1 1,4-alpha-glucan branching enzyme [Agrilactobacillus composti DSM 18527 = JCM 14202]